MPQHAAKYCGLTRDKNNEGAAWPRPRLIVIAATTYFTEKSLLATWLPFNEISTL